MTTIRIIIVIAIFHIAALSAAQQTFIREKRDYIWMFGYDTAIQTNARNTWLDFNDIPVSTHQRVGTFSIDITNAGMCDLDGNLLFYTNGYVVNDPQPYGDGKRGRLEPGGDDG